MAQLENTAFLPRTGDGKLWVLLCIILVLAILCMSVFSLKIKNDRNALSYRIFKLQQSITVAQEHIGKMEVERDSLLSPYILNKQAKDLGLSIADPGQVRRMTAPAVR